MFLNYRLEKKELITKEDLESLGWVRKDNDDYRKTYEKGNYWLLFTMQGDHTVMQIIAVDPTRIEWLPNSPEIFRVVMQHPTLEAFKAITAFI